MEIDFSNLHHAYLLIGRLDDTEQKLHEVFSSQGLTLVGSPDYFVFKEPTFGIEQARTLGALAIRKAFGDKKVFLLAPESVSAEAQNALLKTFEEPIPNTHFFLVVSDEQVVLPTLRSRMRVLHVKRSNLDADSKESEVEKFLKSSIKDRLSFTKKFVDAEKNLSAFLDELLLVLRKQDVGLQSLSQVHEMRLRSGERSASTRLILEHLSLVL